MLLFLRVGLLSAVGQWLRLGLLYIGDQYMSYMKRFLEDILHDLGVESVTPEVLEIVQQRLEEREDLRRDLEELSREFREELRDLDTGL